MRNTIFNRTLILLLGCFLIVTIACQKTSSADKEQDTATEMAYDENANAHQDISRAVSKATMTNKRILLVFGANWCPWCRALHKLFETNAEIHQYLQDHFEVVLINVGHRDKNADLNEKYGNVWANGIPVIVILDSNGEYLATQETGSLEYSKEESKEKGHNPEKVMNFLHKWSNPLQST
jgi:thioredoxin-related protein